MTLYKLTDAHGRTHRGSSREEPVGDPKDMTPQEFADFVYESDFWHGRSAIPTLMDYLAARDKALLETAGNRAVEEVSSQGHTGVNMAKLRDAILGRAALVPGQIVKHKKVGIVCAWGGESAPADYESVRIELLPGGFGRVIE